MRAQHEIELRVRYAETDTLQVVYYSRYFEWFESGRVELLRSVGLVYKDWEDEGLRLPVVEAHASYKAPARIDDRLLLRTWVGRVGNSSIRFENEVAMLPGRELLCTGYTVHVLIDRGGRPIEILPKIREKLLS